MDGCKYSSYSVAYVRGHFDRNHPTEFRGSCDTKYCESYLRELIGPIDVTVETESFRSTKELKYWKGQE